MAAASLADTIRVMDVRLHSSDHCTFAIAAPAPIANALRRELLSRVPCWGIDAVTVEENTSRMSNETIATRISLVPLKVEGALGPETRPVVEILAEGPCVVTAASISAQEAAAGGWAIGPAQDSIVICTLEAGQRLNVGVELRRGCGREHARFGSVETALVTPRDERCESGVFDVVVKTTGAVSAADAVREALSGFSRRVRSAADSLRVASKARE